MNISFVSQQQTTDPIGLVPHSKQNNTTLKLSLNTFFFFFNYVSCIRNSMQAFIQLKGFALAALVLLTRIFSPFHEHFGNQIILGQILIENAQQNQTLGLFASSRLHVYLQFPCLFDWGKKESWA